MIRARNVVLLALVCLAAAGARAQEWRGSAAILVEVKGKPMGAVPDALVILRYQQMEPPAGPRPVVTDAAGRAVVADLAEGLWEVEVSHDEFLSFVALVMLESGRKPQVQASFLQASGSSLTPIRVKFADGKGKTPSPSVPLPPEAAERLAQRRPLAPQRPPATATPADPVPARRPTRPPEPVIPEPELRPLPEAAQPTPAAATPPPPAPAPSEPEGVSAPSAAQPEATEPAPPPAPPPTPEPGPAEPAPVVPAEPEPEAPAAEPAAPTATEPVSPPEPTPIPEPEPEPAEPRPAEPAPPPPTLAPPPRPQPEPAMPEPAAPPAPEAGPNAEAPPAPAPEPDTPPAAEPAPAPPETLLPEPAEPVAPQPVVEEREPVVVPPESVSEAAPVEAEPAPPPPAAALPPPGRLGPTLRAYRDRTCVECRPGEFAISIETVVGPSSGPCGDRLDEAGRELAALLGGSVTLELKELAAPAEEAVGEMAASDPTARVTELLGDDSDACRLVAAVIPKAGRFRGLRMEAADATGIGDCQADRPCPVGRAYWVGQPRVAREPSANVIWGIFVNEAPDRARRARLTVYFAAPNRAWDPPR